jgi:hypothetical protein
MAFTGKQQRNGTNLGGADQNTPMPGPYPDVGAVMAEAQGYAQDRMGLGRQVFDGGGLPAGGPVDWDDSIAVTEQPGEM